MSKSTKTVLGAIAASVIMVAGLNMAFAKPPEGGKQNQAVAAERTEKMLQKLQTELEFSDEQIAQAQAVLEKNRAEMEQLREQLKALHEKMRADMSEIMTDEQLEKFEMLKEDKKAKKAAKKEKDGEGKRGGRNSF